MYKKVVGCTICRKLFGRFLQAIKGLEIIFLALAQ
jgi:hypothetical protein